MSGVVRGRELIAPSYSIGISYSRLIVVSAAFKQVDHAPNAKYGSQCDNKGLQYINGGAVRAVHLDRPLA